MIASGAPLKPLAPRFGLGASAVYNHARKHVTDQFKRSVRVGPFASEEKLREICAENGESVLTQLRAINGAVSSRWLVAFESDAHDRFIDLTTTLRKNLELLAKLTKELAPAQTNIALHTQVAVGPFERPEYVDAIATIVAALRPFPEARRAVAEALRAFEIARGAGKLTIEERPTFGGVPLIEPPA